jgi:hypothetical protein
LLVGGKVVVGTALAAVTHAVPTASVLPAMQLEHLWVGGGRMALMSKQLITATEPVA